jgi:pimeloyl-ACP methyl ester carboxylesterase
VREQPQILQDYLRQLRAPSRKGYAYQLLALSGWTSLWWLPLLRQRALILAGSEDPLVPLANAQLMQRLLRHAELHTIADGHLFLHTRAAHVAPLIERFLAD